MDKQSSDQELTFETSSEDTSANDDNVAENQDIISEPLQPAQPPEPVQSPEAHPVETETPTPLPPPPTPSPEPEVEPPKKAKKRPWFLVALLLVVVASVVAWWLLIEKDIISQQNTSETQTQTVEGENEPFENVLYYAYYENGITYIKSIDLDESGAEKKALIEFGEKSDNASDGDHYGRVSAPVSISKDGSTVLYSTDKGVYEHNLTTDSRDSIFRFEMTSAGFDGKRLDKVIVTETGENIRNVDNENFQFRLLGWPEYSYAKNAFGFTERHYEGASFDVFDRDNNSLVDIGDTFVYISGADAGALAFTIDKDAKELIDYGLYPQHLFDVVGGVMDASMFNESRTYVASVVRPYDEVKEYVNYETGVLVRVSTDTGAHEIVKNVGKDTYGLVYQSNDTLSVIDSNEKSYVLRQFDKELNEIPAQDLAKVSGITGELVDADLQLINDKIYIELTTKTDKTFKTYIYNYDDKEFITEFLIAEDSDVKVLKHE